MKQGANAHLSKQHHNVSNRWSTTIAITTVITVITGTTAITAITAITIVTLQQLQSLQPLCATESLRQACLARY
jgi:hypothetical protein